jgi:hypothetical protein
MTPIDTGVKLNGNDPQSPNVILKVPYQRKCSESLLLAVFAEQMQSPKIKGLIKTMNDDDLGIDVAIFHSAIKVGATGVINLDGLKEENDIYKHIKQYKGNKQVIRETPFSDYKVQLNVPEHIFDAYQMFGTQLRRHIMSDFTDSNTTLSIGSSSVSASQQDLLKLYDALISEDIIDEYRKLQDDFSTPDMIKRVLEEEIINNDRNSKDLLNALQIVDGKFVLPLYEPVQSMKVQQMINAI